MSMKLLSAAVISWNIWTNPVRFESRPLTNWRETVIVSGNPVEVDLVKVQNRNFIFSNRVVTVDGLLKDATNFTVETRIIGTNVSYATNVNREPGTPYPIPRRGP